MDFVEFRTIWPMGLTPAVNAASGVVGFVSLLFFYEAMVAKKVVSSIQSLGSDPDHLMSVLTRHIA